MPLKIRVRNFQSIEDATIIIDGLTVVTGTNNAGKSAMFRAIRGAFANTRGFDFVRLGSSHCTVDIEDMVDGRMLTWEKGPKTNRYIVNGKRLDRVGHGVPVEVADFGVTPISVGGQDLWPQIAPQVNGVMFLLDQPGSLIAEAVADVERVNQLNSALKMSESDRKSAKADLKIRAQDGEKFSQRRATFEGLDEAIGELNQLDARREKADKISKAWVNLIKLGERYSVTKASVEALEGLEGVGVKLPSEERVAKAEGFRRAIGITVTLAMRYEAAKRDYEVAQKAHNAVGRITLDESLVEGADKLQRVLGRTYDLRDRLVKSRQLMNQIEAEIKQRDLEFEIIRARAAELLGSFTDCPTCGSALDHPQHDPGIVSS